MLKTFRTSAVSDTRRAPLTDPDTRGSDQYCGMVGGILYQRPVRAHCCHIGGAVIASEVHIALFDKVGAMARERIVLRAEHVLQICRAL